MFDSVILGYPNVQFPHAFENRHIEKTYCKHLFEQNVFIGARIVPFLSYPFLSLQNSSANAGIFLCHPNKFIHYSCESISIGLSYSLAEIPLDLLYLSLSNNPTFLLKQNT